MVSVRGCRISLFFSPKSKINISAAKLTFPFQGGNTSSYSYNPATTRSSPYFLSESLLRQRLITYNPNKSITAAVYRPSVHKGRVYTRQNT